MATTGRSKPSLIPAFVALAIVLLIGYFWYTELEPTRTEHTLNPPIEIIEAQPPLTVIQPTDQAPTSKQIAQQEAQSFIEALAQKQKQAITVNENDDQFVRHDSTIILPKLEHRMTSVEELLADANLSSDTALTLQYTTQQNVETTLAELSDQNDDHTILVTLIDKHGEKHTKPLFEFLNQPDIDITAPITVLTEIKRSLEITAAELVELKDIEATQSVIATINHGTQELSVKDIIQTGDMPDNALFYLHRVTKNDQQGLWGIVQTGLINKFRQGVHIEGLNMNKDTVQAIIPADADEKLPSGFSSFLGKVLNDKVNSSYVYNFSTHTMTHDPNKIFPGQQLILIHFSPKELSDIYQFFSDKRNQGVETFAIRE